MQNKNSLHAHSDWHKFMFQVSFVVSIFVFAIYFSMYLRDKDIIQKQIESSAKIYFQNIVLTRMWNAMYGSVYVEKKPGVETNPYLDDPEFTAMDGRIFTQRNPAIMTREISSLSEKEGILIYRITSLKPLNPNNAPDEFERESLMAFEKGTLETTTEYLRGDRTFFRYMAPLKVTQDCLICHAKQGYRIGDIRGGISVSFDITASKKALEGNRNIVLVLISLSTIFVLGLFLFFSIRLMRKLHSAQNKIAKLVVTDELTGLANRRHFFERLDEEVDRALRYGTELSMLMIDIDCFKKINDTYGHQIGDKVLAEVAHLLSKNVRISDIVARYGGEEFTILLPSLNVKDAALAAEKLRMLIEKKSINHGKLRIKVTISCGIVDLKNVTRDGGNPKEDIIHAADIAMYQAKRDGRNKVVIYRNDKEKTPPVPCA